MTLRIIEISKTVGEYPKTSFLLRKISCSHNELEEYPRRLKNIRKRRISLDEFLAHITDYKNIEDCRKISENVVYYSIDFLVDIADYKNI